MSTNEDRIMCEDHAANCPFCTKPKACTEVQTVMGYTYSEIVSALRIYKAIQDGMIPGVTFKPFKPEEAQ